MCSACKRSSGVISLFIPARAGPEGEDGVEGFWAGATRAADLPTAIPFERWSLERAYSPEVAVDRMYARFAGFIPGAAEFDAAAFRRARCIPRYNFCHRHPLLTGNTHMGRVYPCALPLPEAQHCAK